MIHFLTGKPGGGKSLYGVRLMVSELVHTQRTIVTNLPLKLGALNEYLQAKYSDSIIDIHKRIRVISDDTETKEFYLHRGFDSEGAPIDLKEIKDGRIEFPAAPAPVVYIIDEVHCFFNAREWAKSGKSALYYLSQHRHFGDDLILITQFLGNVDKQFRVLAQDFTQLRNFKNEKFGPFRMPGVFQRRTFQDPPTNSTVAFEVGTFKLDVSGLASCYDTAAGVGIMGGGDAQIKRRGVSWKWAIPIVIAVLGCLLVVPHVFGWGVTSILLPKPKITRPASPAGAPVAGPVSQSLPQYEYERGKVEKETEEKPDPVFVVGFTSIGPGKDCYYLSNNRTLKGSRVSFANDSAVWTIDGKVYTWDTAISQKERQQEVGHRGQYNDLAQKSSFK